MDFSFSSLLRPFWHRLKHPVSSLSHLLGVLLAIAGLVVLMVQSAGRPLHVTSFAIYGTTLIMLYAASGIYHALRVNPKVEGTLYGLDRAGIYLLIAGTYTPICLLALAGGWGWSLFGVVWALAIAGIALDIAMRCRTPHWLQALLYLLTGWAAIVAVGPLVHALPLPALVWLAVGCAIYTGGAVICTFYPLPTPGRRFSMHDLWHVMVLAGSACHFVLMCGFVVHL